MQSDRVNLGRFNLQTALKADSVQEKVGNCNVTVALGDMTKFKCDAYLVPQFNSCASFGGVGGAVARSGALNGMKEYERFVEENGEQPFGKVLLTKSGGGNAKALLHVVSVASSRENEFDTVQTSVYNALKVAQENGIKSVVAPALGTGIIGALTPEQSAQAMISAIDQFSKEGGAIDVSLVIYGDKRAQVEFIKVLQTGSYQTAVDQTGEKKLDLATWAEGMNRDAKANRKFQSEQN